MIEYATQHTVEIIAVVCAVGWVVDNILAEIPAIAANSTFQVVKSIIDKIVEKVSRK